LFLPHGCDGKVADNNDGVKKVVKDFVKIITIDNEIEALLVDSILNEREIPHEMRSYHDAAYDGLFQTQKGWGHVSAPDRYASEIEEIVFDVRRKAWEDKDV